MFFISFPDRIMQLRPCGKQGIKIILGGVKCFIEDDGGYVVDTISAVTSEVVEVLNHLARDYKSIGTMKKELAGLQEALTQAHKQGPYYCGIGADKAFGRDIVDLHSTNSENIGDD